MANLPRGDTVPRSGSDTRAAIQRVALELFTTHGYEATSMREIADALGIKKASLYYHFAGKEQIVRSLLTQRGNEAADLLEWISEQPNSPDLPRAAVLRWIESFSSEKLAGIRFLAANPLLMRSMETGGGDRIGSALIALSDRLAESLARRTPTEVLQLRMALLSINAALFAAADSAFSDEEILEAARCSAEALMESLRE